MCYAFISIPITTANFYFCGCFLMNVIKISIILLEQKVLKRQRITMFQRKTVLVQATLALGVIFLHATLLHASGGLHTKDYFDSVYFTFISYSTIGFGDFTFDWEVILALGTKNYICAASITIFSVGFSLIASVLTMLANLKCTKPKKKKNEQRCQK